MKSIHQVASAMAIDTVAEFVENEATLARLTQLGIDYGQGYAIGYPHPL